MTILFDSRRTVKPAAFGRGIRTTAPAFAPSRSDRAWWADESRRIDDEADAMAEEAHWLDLLERGIRPF